MTGRLPGELHAFLLVARARWVATAAGDISAEEAIADLLAVVSEDGVDAIHLLLIAAEEVEQALDVRIDSVEAVASRCPDAVPRSWKSLAYRHPLRHDFRRAMIRAHARLLRHLLPLPAPTPLTAARLDSHDVPTEVLVPVWNVTGANLICRTDLAGMVEFFPFPGLESSAPFPSVLIEVHAGTHCRDVVLDRFASDLRWLEPLASDSSVGLHVRATGDGGGP